MHTTAGIVKHVQYYRMHIDCEGKLSHIAFLFQLLSICLDSGKSVRRHSRSLVLVYPLWTRRSPGLPRREHSRLSYRLPWRPVRMVWESIRSIRRSDQPRPRQVDGHCTLYRCSVYTRRQRKEGIENGMGRLYPVLLTKRRLADGGNGRSYRCPIGEEGGVLSGEKPF